MHKKLLVLISSLSSGGAERQMIKLLEFLNEKGYKPTVITYSNRQDYEHKLDINRINIQGKGIKRYLQIIKVIKGDKPDVMLSYGQNANIILILLSFFYSKAKVVVSGRNTPPKYDFLVWRILNLYRFADSIILNSFSQTEFIKKYAPFLTSKLITISNFTDVTQYSFRIKQRESTLKIGILARYHPQKNIMRFLEAIKMLNYSLAQPIEYYWYGQKYYDANGSPTQASQYYLQCEMYREKEALRNVFLNDFSNDTITILQTIDIFCLPSLYEGFSNALSEAICCGKPILASDVSDNKYFVENGKNGFLFEPCNVLDIVEAITKFALLSQEELMQYQKNSRIIAEKLFSKEQFLQLNLKTLFN